MKIYKPRINNILNIIEIIDNDAHIMLEKQEEINY